MTTDYPDWTRLFHLVGTDITIPINIVASDVTLPVSIDAVTVAIDVNITAAAVTLPVSIDAVTVTLDVNVVAQAANFTIEFADQSVAVFDAAKWFAHNAAQWFVNGSATISVGGGAALCSRVVPAGKESYILGGGYGMEGLSAVAYPDTLTIKLDAVITVRIGAAGGQAVILDVPIRAIAGQTIELDAYNGGPNAATFRGTIWGYDEDV